MKRSMQTRWRIVLGAMASVAVGAALWLVAGPGSATSASPASAAPVVGSARIAQMGVFPVLARSQTTLGGELMTYARQLKSAGGESPLAETAEPGMMRVVAKARGTDVGIVPSTNGMCIFAASGSNGMSGACSPNETVDRHGVMLGYEDEAGHHLDGVLPAGASNLSLTTVGGKAVKLTLSSANAYSFTGTEEPCTMTYTAKNGKVETLGLPCEKEGEKTRVIVP